MDSQKAKKKPHCEACEHSVCFLVAGSSPKLLPHYKHIERRRKDDAISYVNRKTMVKCDKTSERVELFNGGDVIENKEDCKENQHNLKESGKPANGSKSIESPPLVSKSLPFSCSKNFQFVQWNGKMPMSRKKYSSVP